MALAPLFALTFLSLTAAASSDCTRTYGGQTVPYPFGFSAACPIPLSYSSAGDIRLGNFTIRNFTSQSVIIAVPAVCKRPSSDIAGLFGPNYAITGKNALFLRNCTNDTGSGSGGASDCSINTSVITQRLNNTTCDRKDDDIRCYSNGSDTRILSEHQVDGAMKNCKNLFTVVRYGMDELNQTMLVYGTAEVGWWLDGECRCAANASCTRVNLVNVGQKGFRCECRKGFNGDGFADGDGCWPPGEYSVFNHYGLRLRVSVTVTANGI